MIEWPPPNFSVICPTGKCTHQRDPITGESWMFVEGKDSGAKDAQRYYELAVKYFVSFREIHQMVVTMLNELVDLKLLYEVEVIGASAERNRMHLENHMLPIKETLIIWVRSREALLRLAELFPERREKIEAQVAEQQDVLLAMLERFERRAGTQ